MLSSEQESLTRIERETLLDVAVKSLRYGLKYGCPVHVNCEEFPDRLRQTQAAFVTLRNRERLRGCMGSLSAVRPLVEDVAKNACAAGFEDLRFSSLEAHELKLLTVQISVLSPPEPIRFSSESDLLKKLRPGRDGLLLQFKAHRGTLLPTVWDNVGNRREFLQHLKMKAGLPANFWSPGVRIHRYTTECFSRVPQTQFSSTD